MKRIQFFMLIIPLLHSYLSAMDSEYPALVIIPGITNTIGKSTSSLIESLQPKQNLHYKVTTPWVMPDLGQERCMDHLRKAIENMSAESKKNYILFGTSQGTATSLNRFNSDKFEINVPFPKALILHAIMLSGNSAIHQTTTNMIVSLTPSLPYSYYWVPYLAKMFLLFPFYAPAGEQPILNIEKIPQDLPIIIVHCTNDRLLAFSDAQALYASLQANGNKNVYLFEMPNPGESTNHLANFDAHTIATIRAILNKHNVIQSNQTIENSHLAQYQPNPKREWLDHFNDMLQREKRMWYFDKILKTTLLGLIMYRLYKTNIIKKYC